MSNNTDRENIQAMEDMLKALKQDANEIFDSKTATPYVSSRASGIITRANYIERNLNELKQRL